MGFKLWERCIARWCDTYSAAAAFHSAFDKGGIVWGDMIGSCNLEAKHATICS
jgi:hypothetical protein